MDADAVRARATEFCDAIVAGDVDKAAESMSNELRQRMGEVVSLLPLPSTEATVESVELPHADRGRRSAPSCGPCPRRPGPGSRCPSRRSEERRVGKEC